MMDYAFRSDYIDDPKLKRQFIDFLIDIHGLDLSLWDRLGFWDRKYRPFSFFDGDTLIASLCLFTMDMTVLGKKCKVAQISGVGTVDKYRRQGLNSELTKRAMKWAQTDHEFFFLFSDLEAFPFYKHSGFRRVKEHMILHTLTPTGTIAGAVKLDIERKDHLDLIYRCALEREPVSDLLGINNAQLLLFWCLYFLQDYIYYIEAYDLLILYKREDNHLTVFDIVAGKMPSFTEIYPYIASPQDKTVEFRFMPDKLGLDRYEERPLKEDNGTHLFGDFPLENRSFIFPHTCIA
ncbi:MAG: GNAT family N-acetyltransferase [FCB group bacterium]|nr:GNAT family N-acetyltransferase [FCB group bacterium]